MLLMMTMNGYVNIAIALGLATGYFFTQAELDLTGSKEDEAKFC
jgi:hypothetical protein